MNLLHAIGLMTRAEHERRVKAIIDATEENYGLRFKRAATDLAAQAEEIAGLEKRLNEALCNNGGLAVMVGNLQDEVASLRPDAEAMRKKRAADRKRMAGKRGKA